jgi:hypothetical protein
MSTRYMVRMYEAQDQTGTTRPGTVVKPVDRALSIYASSSEEAERALHRDVWSKKLPSGKVYQLCPWVGNAELIRSISFALDGSSERVFLDPAFGPYGELRRIRLPRSAASREEDSKEQLSLFPPR